MTRMTKHTFTLAATLAGAALFAGSASGAIVINAQAGAWPSSPQVEEQNASANLSEEFGTSGEQNLTQTFEVLTANTLNVETIYIRYKLGVVGKDFTLAIYEVADVDAGTLTLGNPVFQSGTLTTPANIVTANNETTMSFDVSGESVSLSPTNGTNGYAFHLVGTDSNTKVFNWLRAANVGSAGIAYQEGSAIFGSEGGRDFGFAIEGTVIPEPASLALLGLGGLLMLGRGRRA